MEKSELLKMLKAEITDKVDAATIEKLKASKSKKEALSILEGLSIDLNDEMLSAVAGGEDVDERLQKWCIDKDCDGLWCPGFI
ncbi:MAG: hypothetical protein J5574_00060 [Lachnospiraceae bacterium]|nr:hypothetical protein [Lachnospiraceae bacterium]